MFTLPPYNYDREIYRAIPPADRIYMNKLILAEKLGHECGPCGTPYDPAKTYCIRPIMNVEGNGAGGFYKFNLAQRPEGMGMHPGYFFCEWFDGPWTFTEYVNDVATRTLVSPQGNPHVFTEQQNHIVMPDFLKGRSRYMMIEAHADKILEISYRFPAEWARQEIIDDYRTIDPTYDPLDAEFGWNAYERVAAVNYRERGNEWKIIEGSRV